MSFSIPPIGHPAREHICLEFLATLDKSANVRKLPTMHRAVYQAMQEMADDPAIRFMHYVVIRADGRIQLARITRKGHFTPVWTFGKAP